MVDVTVSDNLAVKWLQETLADGSPVTYFTAEMVGDNWQMRRYTRNIHAAQAAELEALRGDVVTADHSRTCYARALEEMRIALININDGLEDEGDRIYLGSTNHADDIRAAWQRADALNWEEILEHTQPKTDLAATNLRLQAENTQLRARNAALEEAAAKVLPFNVENGPDYASVYFGDGSTHSTQAMTMNPQDWLDLEAALRALLNQNGEAG